MSSRSLAEGTLATDATILEIPEAQALGTRPHRHRSAANVQLFERDRCLATLSELASQASQGNGSIVIVSGGPGEGKTALLRAIRTLAREHGLQVRNARGSELESEFAFGVTRQLIEADIRALDPRERAEILDGAAGLAAGVFGLRADRPVDGPLAVLHGLYWILADLAARGPMLLTLDDLHWADVPTLQWLIYLCGRIEDLPVLIVLATRPPEPHAKLLTTLAAIPTIPIITVEPIGERSLGKWIERALGTPASAKFTASFARVTAGNPFAVSELLLELRRTGTTPDSNAAATLERLAPDGVRRNAMARLGGLHPDALVLARALTVLDDGAPLRQLVALCGLDLDRGADAAEALIGAGLLAPEAQLRFVHPLLRSAVYESMSARRRARLHAATATLLASENADPQAIAAHLLHADPAGDQETVEHLRAAANVALCQGAPSVAVTYLRRALAEPPAQKERAVLLAELGRAELIVRDPAAGAHLSEALELTGDPLKRARLALDLADICLYAGEHQRLFELLDLALRDAMDHDPGLVQLVERRRLVMAIAAGLSVAEAELPSCTRLNQLAGEDHPAARPTRIVLATYLGMACAPASEVLPLLEAGLDKGRFLATETADAPEAVHAAIVLISYDAIELAITLTSEMLADAARRGSILGFIHGATFRALAHLRSGALGEAEADAQDALRLLEEQRPGEQALQFILPFPVSYLSAVHRERGELDQAQTLLDGVSLPSTANGRALILDTRARLRLCKGEREDAIADLREIGKLLSAAGFRHPGYQRWRSQLALALAPDEREQAIALAQSELEDARHTGVQSAIGTALGACAALSAQPTQRTQLWDDAIHALSQSPSKLDLARALIGSGSELRRVGKRAAARDPLRQALELASLCGADPLAHLSREELRAADGRPRRPWLSGVNALTPSELRVARHAANGLSNRDIAQALFVTTKTVEMHLSNCYRKLGLKSREKLAATLEAREPHRSPAGRDQA